MLVEKNEICKIIENRLRLNFENAYGVCENRTSYPENYDPEKDTKKDNDEPDPFDQFLDEQKKDKVSAGLVPPPPKINFQIIA